MSNVENNPDYDIRVLTLKRRNLPKTRAIYQDKTPVFEGERKNRSNTFVSYQNYHFIDISKPQKHTIPGAYQSISNSRKKQVPNSGELSKEIHTVQSITMLGKDNGFWDEDISFLNITFIQLSNTHNWDFSGVEKTIDQIMFKHIARTSSNNVKWCIYFSLDFSDAILFTQNMALEDYHSVLWDLSQHRDGCELIRDTFTLYCFGYDYLVECFRSIKNGEGPVWNDHARVSIRLSVQYTPGLGEFLSNLKGCGITYQFYSLSGRYDLEIKTDDISGRDILKILYYLDLQSDGKENEVFPNYDITFLIAQPEISLSGLPAPQNHKIMNTASALLNVLYDRSCIGYDLHENYAKETSKGLRGLLKRGYSDEFAISVLPSFVSYLQMREKMEAKDTQKETFAKSLSAFMHRYFGAINTLASCTMHNERQFIQAPSYNATYFDIPPKLLAFYSAIAYNISKALCEKEEEPYRFIIIPDYRKDIYVKPLDVKGAQPAFEHLAVVYLNERYFYEPVTAIQLLAHEIGHYVGTRKREMRAKKIFLSVSTLLLYQTPVSQLIMNLDPDSSGVQKSVLAILADSLSDYLMEKYNSGYKSDDGIKWSIASIKKFLQKQKWGILFLKDAIFANELSIIWEKCLKSKVKSDSHTETEFGIGLQLIDGSLNTNFYSQNPHSDISFSVFARTIIQYAADLPGILNYQSTDSQSGYAFFEEFMESILRAYSESLSDLRMIEICNPEFDPGKYRQLLLDTGGEINVQRSLRHDAVCLALAGEQQWKKWVTPQNCDFDKGNENMIFVPIVISHHIADYLKECKNTENLCGIVADSIAVFSANDTYKQAELIQRTIIDYRNKLCMDCVETHNKFSHDDSLREKVCKTCTNNSCEMNPSSLQLTKPV